MTSKTIVVKSTPGTTHATELIRKASSFTSSVTIGYGRYIADAKSLISLLSLGIKPGMELVITTEGRDEEIALETISSMITD